LDFLRSRVPFSGRFRLFRLTRPEDDRRRPASPAIVFPSRQFFVSFFLSPLGKSLFRVVIKTAFLTPFPAFPPLPAQADPRIPVLPRFKTTIFLGLVDPPAVHVPFLSLRIPALLPFFPLRIKLFFQRAFFRNPTHVLLSVLQGRILFLVRFQDKFLFS